MTTAKDRTAAGEALERLPQWLAWASGRAPIPEEITPESPDGQIISMLAECMEENREPS